MFNTPKGNFAQEPLQGEQRTEDSERTIGPCNSLSGDFVSQASWHTLQQTCSPEASGEPSTVDTIVTMREDPLPEGLNAQTQGSSMPGQAIPEDCPGDSKRKPNSAGRAAPLSSLFSLPNFSSLNWISSLSLVSGLGSVLQFSRNGLQMDKRDGEFLSSAPQPDPDLRDLPGQATDYF